nr:hypothetical protein [Sphingomonas rhizophila]
MGSRRLDRFCSCLEAREIADQAIAGSRNGLDLEQVGSCFRRDPPYPVDRPVEAVVTDHRTAPPGRENGITGDDFVGVIEQQQEHLHRQWFDLKGPGWPSIFRRAGLTIIAPAWKSALAARSAGFTNPVPFAHRTIGRWSDHDRHILIAQEGKPFYAAAGVAELGLANV